MDDPRTVCGLTVEELQDLPCEMLHGDEGADLFEIDSMARHVESDGSYLFEWKTACGALVTVYQPCPGEYEVAVERDETRVRNYRGERAKRVYDRTVELFEAELAWYVANKIEIKVGGKQ